MATHSSGMEEQVAEFICYSQDAWKQYAFPWLAELKLVSWLRDFILENKKNSELLLSWAKRCAIHAHHSQAWHSACCSTAYHCVLV